MTVLPAQHIRDLCVNGWFDADGSLRRLIEPFTDRGEFRGKTYGLGPCTYDFRVAQSLVIPPGGFALASTVERVDLPADICAQVLDKSSWARVGLSVFNTHFDPGFEGFPTVELANHSAIAIELIEGMAVCQFKFQRLIEPTDQPYRGKYQQQPARPVEAVEGRGPWDAARVEMVRAMFSD